MPEDCSIICGPTCEWIFDRITVLPQINGGTRVEWSLHPQFTEAEPHTFQLQMGRTGNPLADDWIDVGAPVTDTFYAIDGEKRVYGKTQWTHYRILITANNTTYASKPQDSLGALPKKEWLTARAVMRAETLRLRKEAGIEGYLLKRKLFGTKCTECRDTLTDEIRDPDCTTCYGTGFIGGYYPPYPCYFAELSTKALNNHIADDNNMGTVDQHPVVKARSINVPQLFSNDVFVAKKSDNRWLVRAINNLVEIRGVPIVVEPQLRLIPYSDIIYTFNVSDE